MEYIRCQQKVLPIRFAFLVSFSDGESVINAVKYSTVLWGGLGNTIVPIWKKFPNREQKKGSLGLLTDFDPDFIVNLTSVPIPKEISDKYGKRILSKAEFIKKEKEGLRFCCGLTILPLLNHLWTTETRSITGKSRALLLKNIKGRYLRYWSFVFGCYPSDFDFSSNFVSALKSRELNASFVNLEKIGIDDFISPIDLTTFQLTRIGQGGAFASHSIYIGNPTDLRDLVDYWNIRASGCEILFVPTTHYKKFNKHISHMVKMGDYPINETIQNQAEMQKGLSIKEYKFKEVCDWIRDELKHNLSRRSFPPSWGARRKRISRDTVPCKYVDSESTCNLMFDGEHLSPLELIRPTFFKEDNVFQNYRREFHDKNYWANEIQLNDNYKNEHFFSLPNDPSLTDLAAYSFIFGSHDKVRLSEDGVIYYNNALLGEVHVNPVKTEEVIGQLFKKKGMELSPSPAGIFAQRIIEHMDGIDGCRVFKIRGIREALIELSKQKPRFGMTHGDLRVIVGKRQTDKFGGPNWDDSLYKDLVTYYKQPRPLTPEVAIDSLFKKNVFRVGLRFTCQNCGKKDWYHLTEFDINFTCRYCFKNQHIGTLEGNAKKEWHYKTDGLFMIPNTGDGSLSVILTLWRLHHLTHGNSFKYVTSQNIKGVKDGEVDFIVMMTNHFQMGNVMILGEARNYVDFSSKDVSKLIKIGSKFSPKPYLCFATLKDKFSDKEKIELKRVIKHGFGLIPLTRLELDPYDLYDRFDSLKNKYAVTLEDFAFNVCALNFGLNEKDTYDLIHADEKKMLEKFLAMQKKKTDVTRYSS